MSYPQLTPDGVQIQTYEEIVIELEEGYKVIYGNDINLSTRSPDGQRIAIEAKARLDVQTYGLSIYNQLDPDLAEGLSLEKIIKLSGIQRRPASLSQVDLTLIVDRVIALDSGFKVEDDIGQIWLTDSLKNLVVGSNSVTFFADEFGSVEALPNTITNPVTIVQGILSVNNATLATVGLQEETDEELRIRRNNSLQNPATSTVGGLFSVLGNLQNVTALSIYENDTAFYDGALNLNPHSLWIIIQGGSISDIAEGVVKNKTAGTGLKGDTEGTYQEIITLSNGIVFDNKSTIEFDRPIITDIHVRLDAQGLNGVTPNESVIKDAIALKKYNIGQTAVASELYGNAYSSQGNIILTSMEISIDNIAYTDDTIIANPQWIFNIDLANITINLI